VGVIDLTSNKIAKGGNWTSQTPKAGLSLTQDLSKVHSGSVSRTTSVKRAETAKKPSPKKEKTENSLANAKPAKYQINLKSTMTSQ
jgi:hypothetical protein